MEGENKDMKMKKLVALAVAGMLCLGMSVTAFAANSLTPEDAAAVIENEDGTTTPLVVEDLDEKVQEVVDTWKDDSTALEAAVKDAVKNNPDIKLEEGAKYAVVGAFDYDIQGGLNGDTEIKFDISKLLPTGLKEGETLYLMHGITDANGNVTKWVLVNTTVEGDYATATFDSLSPIAFIVASNGDTVLDPDPIIPTPEDPDDSITVDELVDLIVKKLQESKVTVNRTVVSSKVSPKTGE